jgi:hypothetical protein
MEHDLNLVFRQARDAVESLLGKYGFRIIREVYDHASFGSAQVEYCHRAYWLRLTWDGKEGQLELEGAISPDQHVPPDASAWHSLGPTQSSGSRLEPGPTTDVHIAELLTQIELFRASKAKATESEA